MYLPEVLHRIHTERACRGGQMYVVARAGSWGPRSRGILFGVKSGIPHPKCLTRVWSCPRGGENMWLPLLTISASILESHGSWISGMYFFHESETLRLPPEVNQHSTLVSRSGIQHRKKNRCSTGQTIGYGQQA